jgi:hypothetical protein
MKKKVNYCFLLFLIIISGCETPIDLNLNEMDSKYFVEGYITSDSSYQYVKLCNTKNYLADNSFVSVSDADVFVIELMDKTILNTISFKYDLIQQKYKSINPMSGTAGRVYQLHIIIGDKEIVGEDIMNTKFYLDSLKFQETRQTRQNQSYHYFDILGYVQEPGATKNDAYMWDAEFKGKSLTNTLRNKNIQNDEPINGNYLSGMTVIYSWAFDSISNSGRTNPFAQGDTITVLTSKINNAFYKYTNEIMQSIGGPSPLSGPAANPKGNLFLNGKLQDGVYGYFTTKAISRMQIKYDTTRIMLNPL